MQINSQDHMRLLPNLTDISICSIAYKIRKKIQAKCWKEPTQSCRNTKQFWQMRHYQKFLTCVYNDGQWGNYILKCLKEIRKWVSKLILQQNILKYVDPTTMELLHKNKDGSDHYRFWWNFSIRKLHFCPQEVVNHVTFLFTFGNL